jgi:hypothetical protein
VVAFGICEVGRSTRWPGVGVDIGLLTVGREGGTDIVGGEKIACEGATRATQLRSTRWEGGDDRGSR